MGKISPVRVGSLRWFSAWLGLCLYLAASFQPASAVMTLVLAGLHGHDHIVAVRSDGNHLDLVLSHHEEHESASDHHAWPAEVFTVLAATHDHEGNDHVLHFVRGMAPDQFKGRIDVSRTAALPVVLPAGTIAIPTSFATDSLNGARPPPSIASSLVCLRSVVLLV